jgi:hypothetical protein
VAAGVAWLVLQPEPPPPVPRPPVVDSTPPTPPPADQVQAMIDALRRDEARPTPPPVATPDLPPAVVAPPLEPVPPRVEPAPAPPPPPIVTTNVEPARPVPPPLTPRADLDRAVRAMIAAVPCARLEHRIDEAGRVTITGVVASPRQVAEIGGWVTRIDGVAAVDPAVRVVPAEHCVAAAEVVRIAGTAAGAPALRMSSTDGIFRAGDVFIGWATAPPSFGGYLYVDYFFENGEVYHLLPEELTPANAVRAGETLRVGRERAGAGERDRVWDVSAPFGDGRIVVIASETPLHDGLRPLAEPIADYLAFLERALPAAARRGRVGATAAVIETRPRT